MLRTVTETKYYSIMDNAIELPTLEQILTILIQPKDEFTIEFENNFKDTRFFTSPLFQQWNRENLFKAVFNKDLYSGYQLTGQEKVIDIMFFIDDTDIDNSRYVITIKPDISKD